MNTIHEFYINKVVKREVKEETKKGVLTSVVDVEEPVKVIFKRPNRLEVEKADMIYAVEYGKCVREGVLTRPLIEKLYDEKDKSGILSDNFTGKYMGLLQEFWTVQSGYTEIQLKDKKTKKDEDQMAVLAARFGKIKSDLQGLEAMRNSLFEHTAENKAQKKTILWLTLHLTYTQEEGKEALVFFKGDTFEDKLDEYERLIESEDKFTYDVIDKMAFFVSLWYLGRANTKEDFTQIEKNLQKEEEDAKKDEKSPVEVTEEDVKDEKTAE